MDRRIREGLGAATWDKQQNYISIKARSGLVYLPEKLLHSLFVPHQRFWPPVCVSSEVCIRALNLRSSIHNLKNSYLVDCVEDFYVQWRDCDSRLVRDMFGVESSTSSAQASVLRASTVFYSEQSSDTVVARNSVSDDNELRNATDHGGRSVADFGSAGLKTGRIPTVFLTSEPFQSVSRIHAMGLPPLPPVVGALQQPDGRNFR